MSKDLNEGPRDDSDGVPKDTQNECCSYQYVTESAHREHLLLINNPSDQNNPNNSLNNSLDRRLQLVQLGTENQSSSSSTSLSPKSPRGKALRGSKSGSKKEYADHFDADDEQSWPLKSQASSTVSTVINDTDQVWRLAAFCGLCGLCSLCRRMCRWLGDQTAPFWSSRRSRRSERHRQRVSTIRDNLLLNGANTKQ